MKSLDGSERRPGTLRYPAIAVIEFESIAAGITAGDAMVKKASLSIINAGTVHPGRYLILIGGEVGPVEESYNEGLRIGAEMVRDHVIIPDVHPQVHDAIFGKKLELVTEALGVIETSAVPANIIAADAAVKGAKVEISEIRLADDLGGNSFTIFGGEVEDVQAAIDIGKEKIENSKAKVYTTVVPRIDGSMASEIGRESRFFKKNMENF